MPYKKIYNFCNNENSLNDPNNIFSYNNKMLEHFIPINYVKNAPPSKAADIRGSDNPSRHSQEIAQGMQISHMHNQQMHEEIEDPNK